VRLWCEPQYAKRARKGASQSKNRISILISKAIDGFMKFKVAEGLSKRTIDSYEFTLGH